MRIKILAASLVLAALPAYAADPIELLPVDIRDARASTGANAPENAGSDCRPTLLGGCVRFTGPREGQVADTSKPGPTPSKPDPDKPDPGKPDPDKPDPDKPDPDKPDPDKPDPDKPDPDKT